jgi:Ulp1 family protease
MNNINFIAGPHFINNNHWVAFIIDLKQQEFQIVDPKGLDLDCGLLSDSFSSWLQYLMNRDFCEIENWNVTTIQHPIQTDSFNCGIFVTIFIEQYITKRRIELDLSKMMELRQHIATIIQKSA